MWAFSLGKLFIVTGNNPYYSREVYGVPGTSLAETIVPTPYGIMYQAKDGIRLFNGSRSERAGWLQLGKLLSGEDVENLDAFVGTCATWYKEEYIISDGTQTLAYNISEDKWRDLGVGFDCFHVDPLTDTLYAGNGDGVVILEAPATYTDAGAAITFEAQTAQIRLDVDKEVMVNHLFIDANTQGESINLTLVTEQGEIDLGPVIAATRTTTVIPISRSYQRIGIRVEGSLSAQVEIFGIELDADVSQAFLVDKQYKNLLAM